MENSKFTSKRFLELLEIKRSKSFKESGYGNEFLYSHNNGFYSAMMTILSNNYSMEMAEELHLIDVIYTVSIEETGIELYHGKYLTVAKLYFDQYGEGAIITSEIIEKI